VDLQNADYEVEFRCHFENVDEANAKIPFLASCLQRRTDWVTTFYGLDLFRSGYLLRVSDIFTGSERKYYIGWKGRDIGEFANIRPELDEEATDGIAHSLILEWLGVIKTALNPQEIVPELERSGYQKFMSFQGNDFAGYYEPLDIYVKLMSCPVLKWPLLVEIEQMAKTEEDAKECERNLQELCRQMQLQEYVVREEPPLLLYSQIFDLK